MDRRPIEYLYDSVIGKNRLCISPMQIFNANGIKLGSFFYSRRNGDSIPVPPAKENGVVRG